MIELLPDREAETLAAWLKDHPEIHTVSRDRYSPYASGIEKGAPEAVQVADRFHLLMNLGSSVKWILQSKMKELKDVFDSFNQTKTIDSSEKINQLETINKSHTGNHSALKQYKFERQKGYIGWIYLE